MGVGDQIRRRLPWVGAFALGASVLVTAGVATPPASAGPMSWTVVPTPNQPSPALNSSLASVSCAGTSFCMAVGSWNNGTGLTQGLIEEWNGTAWSISAAPNPPDDTDSPLTAVSCASSSFCLAVGYTGGNEPTSRPFAELWNGSTWSLQYANPAFPLPPSGFRGQLYGVSCQSASFCMAVGSWEGLGGTPQGLAMTWNGSGWTDTSVVAVGSQETLNAVSSATPTDCLAVGQWQGPGGALAEHWSSNAWGVVATTPPSSITASGPAQLTSVSCTTTVSCMAVGEYPAGGAMTGYGQWWNGQQFTAIALNGAQSPSTLSGVTCSSGTGCTAVGSQGAASTSSTLVADWVGGSAWRIESAPTPNLPFGPVELSGISCISSACNAVGSSTSVAGPTTQSTLGMVGPTLQGGYWLVASDGGIFSYGDALFYGSTGAITLNAPMVAMAATPDRHGYWLVGSDGGIFCYGDAAFYGSTGAITLNAPMVGMAVTPDGHGYWLVGSDGGIFNYGDAGFYGSLGGLTLNKPIVGIATTADGHGYWLIGADGGIFAFGDAVFYGSAAAMTLNSPVVGMAPSADGLGYWLVAADGGIFNYGDAGFFGSTGGMTLNKPIVGMAGTADGQGYWLVAADGGIFNYGDAGFFGSTGGMTLNKPIVGMAAASS